MSFIETAVLISKDLEVLHWHMADNRSASLIPDSRDLWEKIWEHRDDLLGIAHTHPGGGKPSPSHTDVTTFRAIELGLGRKLQWWIASSEQVVEFQCMYSGAHPEENKYNYGEVSYFHEDGNKYLPLSFSDIGGIPEWIDELRERSDRNWKEPMEVPRPYTVYSWNEVRDWVIDTGRYTEEQIEEVEDWIEARFDLDLAWGFYFHESQIFDGSKYEPEGIVRRFIEYAIVDFGDDDGILEFSRYH